ncbi:lytic murein transglycosylase [Desulfovibrio sp. OttesenSCG-928-G11]|nr:lytic murein transglycosylase [Desulfovibrio sp. OttesenSCG-928-G11]
MILSLFFSTVKAWGGKSSARPLLAALLCLALALSACGASRSTESGSRGAPPAPPVSPGASQEGSQAAAPPAPDEAGVLSAGQAAKGAADAERPSSAQDGGGQGAGPAPAAAKSPAKAQPGVAKADTAASRVASDLRSAYKGPGGQQIAQCWLPLVQRLENDPGARPDFANYFCGLPEYSPKPMGVKVKELFTSAFLRRKKPDDGKPKPPPSRIYRNVVTAAALARCEDFLAANTELFDRVEAKYPVPRELLAALLYVETKLGVYVGKDNAFWSLACMAAADNPDMVQGGVGDVPLKPEHDDWLQSKLKDKSGWAYKELRALLEFCRVNNLDPLLMPGSVYGAIGICQFMPSNLSSYGEDGDGDGVINLFSEADAVFSAARYLHKHGWKKEMSVSARREVLKRYNNLNIYANTILALAESVRTGVLQTGPPAG